MKIDKISIESTEAGIIKGTLHLSRETTKEPIWTIYDYQIFTFTSVKTPSMNANLPWYIDSASLSGSYMIKRHTKESNGAEKLLYTAEWVSTPAKIPMCTNKSVSVIAVAMPIGKVRDFIRYVKIHSSLDDKIYRLSHGISQALIGDGSVHIHPCEIQPTRSLKRKNKEITLPKKSASAPSSPTKRQKTGTKTPTPLKPPQNNNDLHDRVLDLTDGIKKVDNIMVSMQEDLKNVKTLKKKRNFSEKIWHLGVNVQKISDLMASLKLDMLSQDPEPLRKDQLLITEIMNMAAKVETMQTRYASLLENMEAVWKQLGDVLLHGAAAAGGNKS